MRLWLACVCVGLACGGKLSEEPGDASPDAIVITKKDASPPVIDTGVPDVGPETGPPGLGIDVSATGTGFEAEDQIAIAPDGTIAILWQAFNGSSGFVAMQYSFSTDDGQSFSPPKNVIVPSNLAPGDPSLAVDANGNFYATYLGLKFGGSDVSYTRVYSAMSPKGALSFGAPVEVSTPGNATDLYDHPKTFITPAGTILIAYADFPTPTSNTAAGTVARSTDGTNWTLTTVTNAPVVFTNLLWFCGTSSTLYLTSFDETMALAFIGLRTSTDDGVTWSPTADQVSFDADEVAGLDPNCTASGSDVWVMYSTTQNRSPDNTTLDGANHIWVAHSQNQGTTFLARPDVLDSSASALSTLPLMVMDGSGDLDVAYAAGNAQGDLNGSVRFTRASGTTVSASTVVDGPMMFDLSRTSQTWLGDYFGGVARNNAFYLAYPNNASGQTHIFFRKVALP